MDIFYVKLRMEAQTPAYPKHSTSTKYVPVTYAYKYKLRFVLNKILKNISKEMCYHYFNSCLVRCLSQFACCAEYGRSALHHIPVERGRVELKPSESSAVCRYRLQDGPRADHRCH